MYFEVNAIRRDYGCVNFIALRRVTQPSVKCNFLGQNYISIEAAHVLIKHINSPCFIKGLNMSKPKLP